MAGDIGGGVAPVSGNGRQRLPWIRFGIRRGEASLAWMLFLYFFLLETVQYAAKVVRQSTYVDVLGAERLPLVYLLVALASFPVLMFYARLTGRVRQQRLMVLTLISLALGMTVFFWLFKLQRVWVPAAFYVWMTIVFGVAISQFWSYSNHVFDPRQARRLFALVGAGGLLGGITGGQMANLVTRFLGTTHILLATALVLLGMVALAGLIERHHRAAQGRHQTLLRRVRIEEAKGGFSALRSSPLLRLIAALMLLTVVVGQVVDLQFNWAVEQWTPDFEKRTELYGNFFSVMGLLAFIFQLVFTRRIHRVLGVGFAMRVLPSSVAVGTVLLILAAGVSPAAVLVVAWCLRVSETGLRHSLEQSTRELLFLPVPSRLRLQAKAYIDVFVQRFAKGIAAILLLPVTFGLMAVPHASWITLALVTVWLLVARTVRRVYVSTFRDGLKSGAMDNGSSLDLADVTTVTTLVESLGSSEARQVLHGLELLRSHGRGRLVPPLLLYHQDAQVRRRTLEVLAAEGREDSAHLIERAIGDPDAEVRSAAVRALAAVQGRDACEMMAPRLTDPDVRIRAAAVACLERFGGPELVEAAQEPLAEMLSDGDPLARIEACKAVAQIREPRHQETLVQLLYDADLVVVRQAIASVRRRLSRDGPNPLYVPTLISLSGNRRVKHDAREALVAYGEAAIPALVLFMNDRQEQIWVRRSVPKTVARIGTRAALDALLDALDATDAFQRRKVIEALVYLRHRGRDLGFGAARLRAQIRMETREYLRFLVDLWVVGALHRLRLEGPRVLWPSPGTVPTLLQQHLVLRMADRVANLFGLLEVLYNPADVRAAHRSLLSEDRTLRARSLEYLDNTLSGQVRRDVFAVIDDSSLQEKLDRASQTYDVIAETPEETIRRILTEDTERNPDCIGLIVAGLHGVQAERLTALWPEVERLADGALDPVVSETAGWVLAGSPRGGQVERTWEPAVSTMTRIEMVMFLQKVDLFSFCNAEQILRLAGIAEVQHFAEGDTIYRRNEPAGALYCVLEGEIELEGREGVAAAPIRAGETFGVLDILSGHLRPDGATARTTAKVLAIDAEDFFDLLSHNIEIVKALFRKLTHGPAAPERGGLR